MIRRLSDLVDLAQKNPPTRVAVAAAAHKLVLQSVQRSVNRGLIVPLLVGKEDEIRAQAEDIGWALEEEQIVTTPTNKAAAAASILE